MKAIEVRFWARVDTSKTCWLWTGPATRQGHGQFLFNGKNCRPQHVAHELFIGSVPTDMFVRQSCGERLCCNPAHLFYSPNAHTTEKPVDVYVNKFWSRVDKTPGLGRDGNCWEWTGALTSKGYGNFWSGERQIGTHCYSYELANGPIAPGLFVLHKCDNPKCCNPDHLFAGTPKENMQDMQAKGRKVSNGYDQRTHCIRGHELSGDNLRATGNGTRQCKKCSTAWSKAKRAKIKAAKHPTLF